MKLSNKILTYLLILAFQSSPMLSINGQDGELNNSRGIAEKWVEIWAEKWYERYHKEVDAQYPGGRSNLFHDQYIQEALKNLKDKAWVDWKISNRYYLFDDEWFAAEWFYESTQQATGIKQIESTLAFGRIEDDHLISWIEYFDDKVGEYQMINAMKLFDKDKEVPFPWPENTALKKKYRP